jgi:hypothetical protein
MRKTQVTVRFLKDTGGALRYREIDSTGAYLIDHEGEHLGDLYVRKEVIPGKHPEQIKVTLEY